MILNLRILTPVFFSFLFLSNAFSCEDEGGVYPLPSYDDIKTKVAFVGRVRHDRSRFQMIIDVEKAWGSPFKQYADPVADTCFRFPSVMNEGRYHLFLSNRDIKHSNALLSGPDDFFIKLEDAQPFMDKLALRKKIQDNLPNPAWAYCKGNDECTRNKANLCGVNKKYLSNLESYSLENKNKLCPNPRGKDKVSKCVEYFCN